ncbi:hypothetical protein CLV58_109133 [Spirosoma oryzae]|uniref:Uncharacterized protein n=1 Tax=Spirosoma oryzae TaxID=1469603 RepID=A0A2T0SYB2_9BACT|nr:hypothetical protein [Spirosoma oryzae]PRY38406.1 hypothetical protein CLV58_109133 [Spirosoma oryzae]
METPDDRPALVNQLNQYLEQRDELTTMISELTGKHDQVSSESLPVLQADLASLNASIEGLQGVLGGDGRSAAAVETDYRRRFESVEYPGIIQCLSE